MRTSLPQPAATPAESAPIVPRRRPMRRSTSYQKPSTIRGEAHGPVVVVVVVVVGGRVVVVVVVTTGGLVVVVVVVGVVVVGVTTCTAWEQESAGLTPLSRNWIVKLPGLAAADADTERTAVHVLVVPVLVRVALMPFGGSLLICRPTTPSLTIV